MENVLTVFFFSISFLYQRQNFSRDMTFILSTSFRFQTRFTYFRRELVLVFNLFFSLNYHFNFDAHCSMSSYCKLFVTCHFNIFDLSCFSFLSSEEDPRTTPGIEFFRITVNGLWLLSVVVIHICIHHMTAKYFFQDFATYAFL